MTTVEMLMPRMGESIMEGTILKWLKKEGDQIEQDDSVLEVATDKVDTEVPATHSGILKKILVQEGEVAEVGKPIAIIEQQNGQNDTEEKDQESAIAETNTIVEKKPANTSKVAYKTVEKKQGGRFYSPLVKNIAREEGISEAELDKIEGSGKEGRVTKKDILDYVNTPKSTTAPISTQPQRSASEVEPSSGDEIIQMDRMRKMISQRMLESKQISAHVTSFVEADVTNLVRWRNKVKDEFLKREGEPLTYTPIFIEAVAQAIRDFPMINVSVSGNQIIKRKNINVGMAVALPNGNLIVPVIRNADQLSLIGLSKKVNELAEKARNNKLTADELSEGTYTMSNIGSFGNIMGTPIIMQPQVAILAIGSIVKKPSVIETSSGDAIGIRSKMYLSHSYDHRVVDGALGGLFVKRVADLLESFDIDRVV
jgi:2-oxoglutarate dehydrogenase E2 component (dihydrolipoamide succinyltransferase)